MPLGPLEVLVTVGRRCLVARGLPWSAGLRPGWGRCALAVHRGHGAGHWDLFLEHGRLCLTVAIRRSRHGVMIASWLPPHRRRYLDFSGPVSGGRGHIRNIWNGFACWRRMGRVFVVVADIRTWPPVVAARGATEDPVYE